MKQKREKWFEQRKKEERIAEKVGLLCKSRMKVINEDMAILRIGEKRKNDEMKNR